MISPENRKHRQVVLVTGAARGIGRSIAENLADQDCFLALNDINGNALSIVVHQIEEAGHHVQGFPGDVGDPNAVEAMVNRALESFGRIDSMINNAGIGGTGKSLLELSLDEWEEMIRVDLTSTFLLCRAVLPHMISQGRGRIVHISSISAMIGVAGSTHYAAAKAGVIGFSKALAREVAADRINVNVVAPGLIDTDMSRKRGIDHQRHLVAWPRIGKPEDVAAAVAFLISDHAEYITGQVLSPNGGAYM